MSLLLLFHPRVAAPAAPAPTHVPAVPFEMFPFFLEEDEALIIILAAVARRRNLN